MSSYKEFQKLNIGCGVKKEKDAWNIDSNPDVEPDEVVDIIKELPYEDNSFQKVIADYVLCQICKREDLRNVLNEIHRVLKPNGILKLKVANAEANYSEAIRDPWDCREFVPETFTHFDVNHYRYKVFKYGFKPWHKISVKPERETRLLVKMSPYK
ncbi:MAG: methyltransferase domain-containing protein [Pelagibacterales bacterium]|nr:methyltransferase domain-containing protein [Pelagibacterales bacterium]